MRGISIIATLIALLIGGLVYVKRMKTIPQEAHSAKLLGPDGKAVKDLRELPAAVDQQLKAQMDEMSKKTTKAAVSDDQ